MVFFIINFTLIPLFCNIKMSVPVNKYEHLSIHFTVRTTTFNRSKSAAFYKFCGNKLMNYLISQFNTLHVMEVYIQFNLRVRKCLTMLPHFQYMVCQ